MSVTREEILILGWLLVLPAAPVAGLLGYVLARKLAKQVDQPPLS